MRPSIVQKLGQALSNIFVITFRPPHLEMDASHEKLASLSESDAVSVSGLPQDLMRLEDFTRSDSPKCVETISTLSDLSQAVTLEVVTQRMSKSSQLIPAVFPWNSVIPSVRFTGQR